MSVSKFPDNFIWGAATSAYQIEGATTEDGRGLSVWDTFVRRPGKIFNNDTSDIACNHYHRYKEDVALMKSLGLKAYRFSIAWPRIFPKGEGKLNQKGLDFYNLLVDELLEAKIIPFVTFFHWDLPQALEDKYGGWRSKEVSKYFADYCAAVARSISDRVINWITINEIMCFTIIAHKEGRLAPGEIEPLKVVNQTVHNALFAHGLAVQAIRENAKRKPKIGLAENLEATWPILDTKNHIEASKNAFKDLNSQRLVPLFEGKYGEAFAKQNKDAMPDYTEEEMKTISTPLDYIGYNFYQGTPIRYSENEKGYELVQFPIDYPKTDMDWPVTPKALYYAIMHTKDCFGNIPIYITENGMAAKDRETENGEVLDLDRLEYLRMHLEMLSHAIADGGNVKGYFVWSLMDNFEWSHGYSKRFGILRVNYSNMERTLKLSGKFYSDVIKKNAINGI